MATKTYAPRGYKINTYVETGAGYTDFVGSPSKVELLKEFVHSPTMSGSQKYAPNIRSEDSEPNYGINYENSSSPISPNKLTCGYFTKEPIRTHSGSDYVRPGNMSGPIRHAAGLSTTHHQNTTSTNNINEALHDPKRRYARPAFGAKR